MVFLWALCQYLRALCVPINLNMLFKIDDCVELFSREKIKFTYLSKKNQVNEMKNVLLLWARGITIDCSWAISEGEKTTFLLTNCEQGKL